MMKKIISLTKVFYKDYYKNLNLVNKNNKLNKKSIFVWAFIIVIFAVGYISYHIINYLNKVGQPEIFLNIYMLILAIMLMFQTILISTNVYYFSKDLEFVLPLPIKPLELLIAKFNTLLTILYSTEIIFAFVPLSIYGLIASNNIFYFFWMILVLIVFPILFAAFISVIMLFVMQLSKFVKNKDVFQFLITTILSTILCFFEIQIIFSVFSGVQNYGEQINENEVLNDVVSFSDKLNTVNNYLLIINPSVNILKLNNNLNCLFYFFKIIFINLIFFIIFILVGKRLYLKNILKNISMVNVKKEKNSFKKNNYKLKNKNFSYIIQEFKNLIKNPTFFMQCIFPTIIILITVIFLINILYPVVLEVMKTEEIADQVQNLSFNIEAVAIILCIIQIFFTFSNISLTAISRKGKNAFFIKYIPISLYKQFLFLNVPQILINIISSAIILITLKKLIPEISIMYFIVLFILSLLINLINSFLMVIVDLKRPNINWDIEVSAIKQNENKIFQYVLSICIILFLSYLSKVMVDLSLKLSIILINGIFILFIVLINLFVKKNIDKLFKKVV